MVRIVGYSWTGVYADDFEEAIGFFADKLGLPLEWRQEDADFAGFRMPSGQLLELFGPRWADTHGPYEGAHPSTSPILGFEVEDVGAAREELASRGVQFVTEALEFEGGASSAKFLGPDGRVYEVWRPEERFRMGRQL
jgi:catechol 2,3-dioxygenase-like lactoylglutathione lyase family enzyme